MCVCGMHMCAWFPGVPSAQFDKNAAVCFGGVCSEDNNPSGQREWRASAALTVPPSEGEKEWEGEREGAMWLTLAHWEATGARPTSSHTGWPHKSLSFSLCLPILPSSLRYLTFSFPGPRRRASFVSFKLCSNSFFPCSPTLYLPLTNIYPSVALWPHCCSTLTPIPFFFRQTYPYRYPVGLHLLLWVTVLLIKFSLLFALFIIFALPLFSWVIRGFTGWGQRRWPGRYFHLLVVLVGVENYNTVALLKQKHKRVSVTDIRCSS